MVPMVNTYVAVMCARRRGSGLIDNCAFQSGVPTSKSREKVRVKRILYRSLCGYTSMRYMLVCDIWLIATTTFGPQASSRTSLANDLPRTCIQARSDQHTPIYAKWILRCLVRGDPSHPKTHLGCNTKGHSTRGRAHPIYLAAKRALSSFYCMT